MAEDYASYGDFKQELEELTDMALVACESYEAWFTMDDARGDPTRLEAMNSFSAFFGSSIRAHFQSLVVTLFKAFEQKHQHLGLDRLVHRASDAGVNLEVLRRVRELRRHAAKPLAKVRNLRNEALAHRVAGRTADEILDIEKLSIDDLEELLRLLLEILNLIRVDLGLPREDGYPYVRRHSAMLLNHLVKNPPNLNQLAVEVGEGPEPGKLQDP